MSHEQFDRLSSQHDTYRQDAHRLRDAADGAERLYGSAEHQSVLAIRAAVAEAERRAGEIGCQMRADPEYDDWALAAISAILGGDDSDAEPDRQQIGNALVDDGSSPTADDVRRFAIRATERLKMYLEWDAPAELVDGEVRRLCKLCGVDPSLPMPLKLPISSN